jgi:hypothetical protein
MTATQTLTTAVNAIDIIRLRALRNRFFADRSYGLERLAADVTMAEWLATIHELRAQMAPVIALLPEAAFAPRPIPRDASEEEWSAGQVVDHVCGAQRSVMVRFIDLVSSDDNVATLRPVAPPDPRPLTRAEALAALEQANARLAALAEFLLLASEPVRTIDNPWFGTLGIRGILLFFAIHEYDHLGQLRVMG